MNRDGRLASVLPARSLANHANYGRFDDKVNRKLTDLMADLSH